VIFKLFHFARFDVARDSSAGWVWEIAAPIWCTKIRLQTARTYTTGMACKDVAAKSRELTSPKARQSFRLGAKELSDAPIAITPRPMFSTA